MTELTIDMTPEKLLEWTRGELELARSANAFICEMASKYAKRETRAREALQKIYTEAWVHLDITDDCPGLDEIEEIAREALASEY